MASTYTFTLYFCYHKYCALCTYEVAKNIVWLIVGIIIIYANIDADVEKIGRSCHHGRWNSQRKTYVIKFGWNKKRFSPNSFKPSTYYWSLFKVILNELKDMSVQLDCKRVKSLTHFLRRLIKVLCHLWLCSAKSSWSSNKFCRRSDQNSKSCLIESVSLVWITLVNTKLFF